MRTESGPWRFVDALPSGIGRGWHAHYGHPEEPAEGWMACDVRSVIRAHQAAWVEAFDAWHAALCRQALAITRWWWLLPASRPNIWVQRATLKPLVFAAALSEWAAAHPACRPIHVVGATAAVRRYLEEWNPGQEPGGRCGPMMRPWRTPARLLKACWTLLGRCLAHAGRWPATSPPAGAKFVFYSHIVQARALAEHGDHFFGAMLEAAESAFPGEVLTAYLLHDEAERSEVERLLSRSGRRFTFLFDHLTRWDACWAAWQGLLTCVSVSQALRGAPPIRLGRWVSRSFAGSFLAEQLLAQPAVVEFAVYRAMKRLIARSGLRVLAYPYEEKALERALLQACAEAARSVRTLGYAHAAHSTGHVALRARAEGMPSPPKPDRLLATGRRAAEFLSGWAKQGAARVGVVGSPRSLGPFPPAQSEAARRESLRVLILIGFGEELETLAAFVERQPRLFAGCEVRIRRYDFAWRQAQDRGEARLLRAAVSGTITVEAGSLRQQLAWCDLALFSSTSAGIQAMLAGRLVISADLQDLFEADPCVGATACFARCATAGELGQALDRARALPDGEYARQVQAQRDFAVSIFAPVDRARLIRELAGEPPASAPAAQMPDPIGAVE